MTNPSDMENPRDRHNEEEFDPKEFNLPEEYLSYGVMHDKHNIKNLTFWSVLGIVIFGVLLVGIFYMYHSNKLIFTEEASVRSEHQEVARMKQQAQERLTSFGVIDEEEGIYHIPIDSAITLYIDEQN